MNALSERPLVSHYENNYGGGLRRPNAIGGQLADHDWAHFRSGSTSERDVDADWSGDHDQQPLYDRLRQGVALRFPSCPLSALTTAPELGGLGDCIQAAALVLVRSTLEFCRGRAGSGTHTLCRQLP